MEQRRVTSRGENAGADISGYAHRVYAESFAEFGTPRELPSCGGWILERDIPGSRHRDGIACYPLFACRDWTRLNFDLSAFREHLVAVSLVTDPFGAFDLEDMREAFDLVRPYKHHYVTDLSTPLDETLGRRHMRQVEKARDRVDLEWCVDPASRLSEWMSLYGNLVRRHRITGLRAFSPYAFSRQLAVPGLVMLRASVAGEAVAMHLWYVLGDVAYAHLGASSELGYRLSASYALDGYAAEQLFDHVRWLAFGAAPGEGEGEPKGGLAQYKRRWATGTRPTYLCGRILRQEDYEELVRASPSGGASYFPPYRRGEFASGAASRP